MPQDRSDLIALDRVIAGYTGPVVGPVSFHVTTGEVVGLGGPNGVGKSTLLRAITGTARLFSGHIHRGPGLCITHHRQRPELPPELPLLGRELLGLLHATLDPVPEPAGRLLNLPVALMSGGEFQLLQAFACLKGRSTLTLLDEPTNNLDSEAITTLSQILRDLPAHQSVILVSHEHDFLVEHCTRIVEVAS